MQGIFITGTDTGVGKTIISAGIAKSLQMQGVSVGVMKPVATGAIKIGRNLISEDAVFLKEAINSPDPLSIINPILYQHPIAPFTASKFLNKKINLKKIQKAFLLLKKKYDFLVIEGIGGIMVPLMKDYLIIDLIKEMGLPIIIVSRPNLGTINHTLLTLKCANDYKIETKGIIFNYTLPYENVLAEKTNPKIIKEISHSKILGVLPYKKDIMKNKNYDYIASLIRKHISLDKIS